MLRYDAASKAWCLSGISGEYMEVVVVLFWASVAVVLYTYILYPLILYVAVALKKPKQLGMERLPSPPAVTIIISAYNEEAAIGRRLENCLSLSYPRSKLEVLVASDGSNDRTVEIAKQYDDRIVRVVAFEKLRGRALVHNDSVKLAAGDLIVFTDAETIFSNDFIHKVTLPFSETKVGCVAGNLVYKPNGGSIAQAEALYYNKLENRVKNLESKLGILANGTGACMAIRKELFKPLKADEDVDTATPIDVILSGSRVIFSEDAIAYDVPPKSARGEINSRMRGVSQTICSIGRRIGLRNWLKHPGLIYSVVSHRIARYLSPFFMIATLILNILILGQGYLYVGLFAAQLLFYFLMLVGWIGETAKKHIPVASLVFSFCVASLGMMLGVIRLLLGKRYESYKTEE